MSSVKIPSDYLNAMTETLEALLNVKSKTFDVYDYGEFGRQEISKPTIVLEYHKAPGNNREPDGRVYEELEVWIHCVIPASMPYADRTASDLSFDIRNKVLADIGSTVPNAERYPRWNWGLDSDSVRRPTNIDRQPSLFKDGDKGYSAWAATFLQRVIYGDVDDDEESRDGISFAVNDSVDDPNSYQELNNADT